MEFSTGSWEIGRQIAKEVPGYSAKDDNTRVETDAVEETQAIYADLSKQNEVKSMKFCDEVDAYLGNSKRARKIDADIDIGDTDEGVNKSRSK
jgi:uncharacterized protein (DUF1499 family)